jgi:hypothetical protein
MGFDQEAYDRLVKKKRKQLRNQQPDQGGDEYQHAVVNTDIEAIPNPEVSPFLNYAPPASVRTRAVYPYDFGRKVQELKDEILKAQADMKAITARLPNEAQKGIGQFLLDGDEVVRKLGNMANREEHKKAMVALELEELRNFYTMAKTTHVRDSKPHPASHPQDPNTITSKTRLVNMITSDYGYSPLTIMRQYAKQQAKLGPPPLQPPPHPPPMMTPPPSAPALPVVGTPVNTVLDQAMAALMNSL